MQHRIQGPMAATACLLGTLATANAAIYTSPTLNLAVPVTPTGLYLNVQTGASSTNDADVPGWDINVAGSSSLYLVSPGGFNFVRLNDAGPSAGPSNLAIGFVVSTDATLMPSASWIAGGAPTASPSAIGMVNLNSANNYFGFKFTDASSKQHLGCMQMSFGSSLTGADRKIVRYAYNDVSTDLPGGQSACWIPAPGPGVAMLLTRSGLRATRRRSDAPESGVRTERTRRPGRRSAACRS